MTTWLALATLWDCPRTFLLVVRRASDDRLLGVDAAGNLRRAELVDREVEFGAGERLVEPETEDMIHIQSKASTQQIKIRVCLSILDRRDPLTTECDWF